MISRPHLCKDEEYVPTCEEDSGHVEWFASKCCGNGISRCHGDKSEMRVLVALRMGAGLEFEGLRDIHLLGIDSCYHLA